MIVQLTDAGVVHDLERRRKESTAGPYDLSTSWLAASGFVAVAEETGAHFDDDQGGRFAAAARSFGIERLVAVVNDEPLVAPGSMAFEFSADEAGITEFSRKFMGINAVIFPPAGLGLAVLCTVDDYQVVAGPREFVIAYHPNIRDARREFAEFIENQMEPLRPVAERAAKLMAWIDEDDRP